MAALALSLDPRGRQLRGISGRPAAPPAPDLERARDSLTAAVEAATPTLQAARPSDRAIGLAAIASLALHLIVAGAALAAFGSETMGGGGSGQGAQNGGGILVELVALAPTPPAAATADENREAEAPKIETAPQKIVLPPRPVDAEAIALVIPPPPVEMAKVEKTLEKTVETPRRVQAKREAPEKAPRKEAAPAAPAPRGAPAAVADTAASQSGQQARSGAQGAAALGGVGGEQIAAVGGMGARILQARFRVTPPPPYYPRRALSQRQQGTVTIRALIGENGAARQIRLHASSGYPLLDKAALQAVGEWQFAPETVDGRPVAVWVEVPVRFRID